MYKQKTLFGLALALIAMVLGTALAMWSETLYVNVEVNTGKVDVSIVNATCSDTGPDPQAPDFSNKEGKDVASCYVEISENGNSATVTISNAYPGYRVEVDLTVKNDGTIPVKLYRYEISEYNTSALRVSLTTPEDTQIDPGKTSTYTLCIRVLQDAEQGASYNVTVKLTFAQWNKVTG